MIKYYYIGGLKLWQTEKKEVYKPKPMTEGKRNAGMPYATFLNRSINRFA